MGELEQSIAAKKEIEQVQKATNVYDFLKGVAELVSIYPQWEEKVVAGYGKDTGKPICFGWVPYGIPPDKKGLVILSKEKDYSSTVFSVPRITHTVKYPSNMARQIRDLFLEAPFSMKLDNSLYVFDKDIFTNSTYEIFKDGFPDFFAVRVAKLKKELTPKGLELLVLP